MSAPKYAIGETIESDAIVGWVREIYFGVVDPSKYVYGIEEPESERIFYFDEQDLSQDAFSEEVQS